MLHRRLKSLLNSTEIPSISTIFIETHSSEDASTYHAREAAYQQELSFAQEKVKNYYENTNKFTAAWKTDQERDLQRKFDNYREDLERKNKVRDKETEASASKIEVLSQALHTAKYENASLMRRIYEASREISFLKRKSDVKMAQFAVPEIVPPPGQIAEELVDIHMASPIYAEQAYTYPITQGLNFSIQDGSSIKLTEAEAQRAAIEILFPDPPHPPEPPQVVPSPPVTITPAASATPAPRNLNVRSPLLQGFGSVNSDSDSNSGPRVAGLGGQTGADPSVSFMDPHIPSGIATNPLTGPILTTPAGFATDLAKNSNGKKLCIYFLRGNCKAADKCAFSHGDISEWKIKPDQTNTLASASANNSRGMRTRTPCSYYNKLRGCKDGDRCRFLHEPSPTGRNKPVKTPSPTPTDRKNGSLSGHRKICRFHNLPSGCKHGDKCPNIHESVSNKKTRPAGKVPSPASADRGNVKDKWNGRKVREYYNTSTGCLLSSNACQGIYEGPKQSRSTLKIPAAFRINNPIPQTTYTEKPGPKDNYPDDEVT